MQNFLIVVDMQKDFIDGALGSAEAEAVVPRVRAKIDSFCGRVIYTRDTHDSGYSRTQEGRRLPVAHCIRESKGWQISRELPDLSRMQDMFAGRYGRGKLEVLNNIRSMSRQIGSGIQKSLAPPQRAAPSVNRDAR